jgi:hypothetical protein
MGVWGRLRVVTDILEKRNMSYVSHGRNDRFVWRQTRGLVTIRIEQELSIGYNATGEEINL